MQNIETFKRYLSDAGLESICTAPYVYKQLSTQRCEAGLAQESTVKV